MATGDWPIDPSVEESYRARFKGPGAPFSRVNGSALLPPTGHPRRCQHANRYRDQCKNWASRGERYCRYHGHKWSARYARTRPERGMAIYSYGRRAGVKLRELLKQLEEDPPDDKLSLVGEIDAARLVAERAVQLFGAACFPENGTEVSAESKLIAARVAQEALAHVAGLVEKHAKVAALSDRTLSADQWKYMSDQLSSVLAEHLLPEHKHVHDACLAAIGGIKVPEKDRPQVSIVVG